MTNEPNFAGSHNGMTWTRYWATRTEEEKDSMRRVGIRFVGMVDGLDDDGSILLKEALTAITFWQQLETDVLTAHGAWLSATKATFERRGWPWTTEELAHRSRLWEVE